MTFDVVLVDRPVDSSDMEQLDGCDGVSLSANAWRNGSLDWLADVRPRFLTLESGHGPMVPPLPERALRGLQRLDVYSSVRLAEPIKTDLLPALVDLTVHLRHLDGPLRAISGLMAVSLDGVPAGDLSLLAGLGVLRTADMTVDSRAKDPVIFPECFPPLAQLRSLQINGGFVTSLDGLADMPQLERVRVIPRARSARRDMRLDLAPLRGHDRLVWLVIDDHGPPVSLEVLDELPSIERVLIDAVDRRWDR
ncbi:hypothetical protein AB6N23_15850 [Cellulomonas sp. 179-A 9B4 NHS]|uniref:hypothetical protein n=1 Tax=Cellulomonas sp. 179-A 9B4 NHS TaxID=3142379 RepID=UPI0039A12FDF